MVSDLKDKILNLEAEASTFNIKKVFDVESHTLNSKLSAQQTLVI